MEANEWRLYAYVAFLDQLNTLVLQVKAFQEKDPKGFVNKKETKLLGAINKLILEEIPSDPSHIKFKLGKTLGDGNTHWYRAKFYQQYRLFFRFNSRAKIIVYAWVNDTQTKRAYESKSDTYLIFQKMLKRNRPPSDWGEIVKFSDPI